METTDGSEGRSALDKVREIQRSDGVERLINGIKIAFITMALTSVVIFGLLAILLIGVFIANATPFGELGQYAVFLMYIVTIISITSGIVNSKE